PVANNYTLRTSQAATSSLNSWTLQSANGGTHTVCNFSLPPSPPYTQAPTVPTGLTATAVSTSQINLSWTASTDNVGVTGYKIFRNTVQVGTATTTSYSDTRLSASTTYTYTVLAYDAAGNNSAQSAPASATTQGVTPVTVSSLTCNPTTLGSNSSSTCTVTLSQAAPTGGASVALA